MRAIALGLALAILPAFPADAQQLTQPSRDDRQRSTAVALTAARQEALAKVRARQKTLAAEIAAAVTSGDRDAIQTQVATYRRAVSAELLLATAEMTPGERLAYVGRQRDDARTAYKRARDNVREHLIARLATAGSDEEREAIFRGAEDTLLIARARLEIAEEAVRRGQPTYDLVGVGAGNATQARLKELLDLISGTYVEEPDRPSWGTTPGDPRGPSDAERATERWLRERERDAAVEEYIRLARGGIFVDLRTGEVVEGVERDRIARNAEMQLVEALRKADLDTGVIGRLMGFEDTRDQLAAAREADIKASDSYRALDLIRPSIRGPIVQEVFRGLAAAVRQEQMRINDWRAQRVPEGGEGGITGWLYEQFVAKQQIGMGRALEISGWDDNEGALKKIDDRIAMFQRDTDAVVAAFSAAAKTENPADLMNTYEGRRAHRLLEAYGYIVTDEDGVERYEIPSNARISARLARDLDLPGSSWLDVISGENVIKLVALAAAPQLAAARAAALLEGLEVGTLGVRLGTLVADALAGTAFDAGFQYAETGEVDVEQLAIEALFVAPVIEGAARAAGEVSGALSALLKDRSKREQAEKYLTATLGMTSEAGLQTYWQARLEGEVSYEDFLSNLITGAVSRAGRAALDLTYTARERAAGRVRRSDNDSTELPEAVRALVEGHDAARRETIARVELNRRRVEAAERSLRDILGTDPSHADAPAKLLDALETGRYSWSDLKTLYRAAPAEFGPLMRAANERRARLAESIVSTARMRAREKIHREHTQAVARLREALRDHPEQLALALEKTAAWRDDELALLQPEPFAPGSKDLTSDVDRSSASPYFRNALKRLTDEAFDAGGRRLPPTSARAYDLNEYVDVFPIIRRTKRMADLGEAGVPGFGALTHRQAVEAASIAAAMLHMTPDQRDRFKSNRLRDADEGHRRTLEVEFAYAEDSLKRGEAELRAEIDRLVSEGADRDSEDTVIRARDNLYGERTRRLRDMEWQLSQMDPDLPETKQLAAEIEREWSSTLREGIEAYATFSGLEVIVMQAQMKDRSVRDLIDAAEFTAEALNFSPEQTRAIVNDQILMIVEHAHAFHRSRESPLDAAAALAKYAERAVLALKLDGADLSSGALKELNEISEALVLAKKESSDVLRERLEAYGDGDVDAGAAKLVGLIERALPGLDGLLGPEHVRPAAARSDAGADMTAPSLAGIRGRLALRRELEREREHERAHHGSARVARIVADAIERMEKELAALRAEAATADRLRESYRREDWEKALKLEDERASLARQYESLPDRESGTGVAADLLEELRDLTSRLADLRNLREGVDDAGPTDEDVRRAERISVLEEQIATARADLDRYDRQATDEAARAASRPTDTLAPAPVDVDVSDEAELGRAAELLFGDLDPSAFDRNRDNVVPPHPPGISPADAPGISESSPAPTAAPDVGISNPSGAAGIAGHGGSTGIPPLEYVLEPVPDSEEPDKDGEGGYPEEPETRGVIVDPTKANDPDASSGGADPTVQRMISVLDDLQGSLIAPGAPGGGMEARSRGNGNGRFAAIIRGTANLLRALTGRRTVRADRASASTAFTAIDRASPAGAGRRIVAPAETVRVFVSSLGGSTGETLEIHIVNDGDRPIEIEKGALVIEPVGRGAQQALQRKISELTGANVVTAKVNAYCLEFLRRPPQPGTVFRFASSSLQRQFAPVATLMAAARRLHDAGRLAPDSDPASYLHATRQWSIWTREQNFDLKRFEEAFVERTKQNLEELGQNWSKEIEQAVRARVPGRWKDIQNVLREAAEIERRALSP